MTIYVVVDENPCFDCNTEDVIAICLDAQKAKDIAARAEAEIRVYELQDFVIVSNLSHPELTRGLRYTKG